MRILMLNNEFPPLGGGTGTVNRAILQQFAHEQDLEIDLITSALGRRREQERFAQRIRIFKVPVNSQNIHHSSNRELLTYAARALPLAVDLQRSRSYDLCFAWSAVPAGGVALALRRMIGLPYLVRVCGPDIPGFERRYGALYPILTPSIRAIWRGAAAVVAKCDSEANMIRAVDRRVKVSLVANGVDSAAFQPASIPDHGPLRLICVARLIERKGQQHLIEAVRRMIAEGMAVTLDLVGTGDSHNTLQAQVAAAKIAEHVHFSGYVPREAIAAHYSGAHVFVLSSFNEGMSVATLEALAAGLPVVVTRTGGTAELVAEGLNGLTFDWGDVDTLTTHLRCLVSNRALARQMGRASRARAELFSWEAAAARYLKLFDKLAARASSSLPNTQVML
jgi:glycosyltransferase involved in cell wall biosynthesis